MLQRNWQHIGSTGTQVHSPAQHSGLRIWHCRSCGLGRNCAWALIPSLGTPYAMSGQKRKINKLELHELLLNIEYIFLHTFILVKCQHVRLETTYLGIIQFCHKVDFVYVNYIP